MKQLILISLCAMPLLQAESEYRSALELVKVFTNPSQKTDKDFEYWIEQLSYHVTHKERFAIFEKHIRECLKKDASHNAFHVFSTHKNLFHSALQVELFKIGLPKVKAAFNERLAQHKRLAANKEALSPHFLIHLWKILKDAHPIVEPNALHDEQLQRYRMMLAWFQRIHDFPLVDQDTLGEGVTVSPSTDTL